MKTVLSSFLILLALLGRPAAGAEKSVPVVDSSAQDSTSAEPRLIVRCERVTVDDMQLEDTLLVTLESLGMPVAGYDLEIGTDSRFITIKDILPGALSDSCGWEYFQARPMDVQGKEDFPSSLWHVVALSKISPDTTMPECYQLEGPVSIMKLVVSSGHVTGPIPDTAAAIFFFWENCADNVFSNETGSSLLMAHSVFDYYGTEMTNSRNVFPTRFGVPRQCENPARGTGPRRVIDFHNGGVLFRLDLGTEAGDSSVSTDKPTD
jgi:hypothetical protein